MLRVGYLLTIRFHVRGARTTITFTLIDWFYNNTVS